MENNPVQVFLRFRPSLQSKKQSENDLIDLQNSTNKMVVLDKTPYVFDQIFHSSSSQQHVFETMAKPSVENVLNGFNNSLLAYGQSGAGKTFTMGLNEQPAAGMVGMSIDLLFQRLTAKLDSGTIEQFKVAVSFIEIYNEQVYDLLGQDCTAPIYKKGSRYGGSTKLGIDSSEVAKESLCRMSSARHVRTTKLNNCSSRSHAIFSIFVSTRSNEGEKGSVMHFCDLAGSEGIRNTNHTGQAQKEGVNINQGLLSVGRVVHALSKKSSVIPYRDSVLTIVLEDSLNHRSFLNFLGCVSEEQADKQETLSTIRFAQSVKKLDSENIPEFNAYMKSKQRLDARTPLKPFMQPLDRNAGFKTPGRVMLPTSVIKKFQHSRLNSSTKFHTQKNRQDDASLLQQTAESIDNTTFNLCNISSSTEFDGPISSSQVPAAPQPNVPFSFSPLMRQLNETIDVKFSSMMDMWKNQTNNAQHVEDSRVHSPADDQVTVIGFDDTDKDFSVLQPATSTVVRNPARARNVLEATRVEATNFAPKAGRTNRRLMTTDLVTSSIAPTARANRRLTTVVHNAPGIGIVAPLRRSVRISMFSEIVNSKSGNARPPILTKKKEKKNLAASYFNYAGTVDKMPKQEHKQNILNIINNGAVKDLVILPTIGSKTAYQIVTYRSVKESFKKIDDLKKLPAMKGKAFEKFIQSNLLD